MISPQRRAEVIEALRRGTVPKAGLDALAVGYGRLQGTLDEELDAVAAGRGAFKAIRGEYGSGKTFFGRWLQERARARGLAAASLPEAVAFTPALVTWPDLRRAFEDGIKRSLLDGADVRTTLGEIQVQWDRILRAGPPERLDAVPHPGPAPGASGGAR